MSFRRRIIETVGMFLEDLGRKGNTLLAGEESDFLQRALKSGARLFFNPRALIKHLVQPQRIQPDYMRRLHFGYGRSGVIVLPPPSLLRRMMQLAYAFYYFGKHVMVVMLQSLHGNRPNVVLNQCIAWTLLGRITSLLSYWK